jgi:hypothetical protein
MTQRLPDWFVRVDHAGREVLAVVCPTCFEVLTTSDGQASCCSATHNFTGDLAALQRRSTGVTLASFGLR